MSIDENPWPSAAQRPERVVAAAVEAEMDRGGRIPCPVCGFPIGAVKGSKAAFCGNCGFKDGCC